MTSITWFLYLAIYGLFLFFDNSANGASIELFSETKYLGNIAFGTASWKRDPWFCYNFPQYTRATLSSLKARGICVILYDTEYCTGRSIKVKDRDVPDISALIGNYTHDDFDNKAVSLRYCDANEGGGFIDAALYNSTNYKDTIWKNSGICRCMTLPVSTRNVASIDNHHNCIRLYSSNNCSSEIGVFLDVFAGKSSVSEDLTSLPIYGQVQSFRPCETPPQCLKLNAEIYEVQVNDDPESPIIPRKARMGMASKSRFKNNGSSIVSQHYVASRTVREVVLAERIKFNSRIQVWETRRETKVEVKTGILQFLMRVMGLMKDAYSYECLWSERKVVEESEQTSDVAMVEEIKEVHISQKIQVPACSYYEVESFVTMVEDYPLKQTVYFQFSGESSGKKLTADELKEELIFMEGYTYNHTVSDYVVAVFANSIITTSFGGETEIVGKGARIRDCNM